MQTPTTSQIRRLAPIRIQVSPGELLDRISILALKAERIADSGKREHIRSELAALNEIRARTVPEAPGLSSMFNELKRINAELWDIEDAVRRCGSTPGAEATFMALARAVYQQNDRRSALKSGINALLNSTIVEVKVYSTPSNHGASYG